jgi:hypothetical protein
VLEFVVTFSPPASQQFIAAGLRNFREMLAHPIQLLAGWGHKLVQWQQDRITSGRDIFGNQFKELATSTLAARQASALSPSRAGGRRVPDRAKRKDHPFGTQPLLDTSAMYQSIVSRIGYGWDGGNGVFPTVTAGATETSTKGAPYPAFVNYGTRRGTPARQWSGISAEERGELAADFSLWVRQSLGQAWGMEAWSV